MKRQRKMKSDGRNKRRKVEEHTNTTRSVNCKPFTMTRWSLHSIFIAVILIVISCVLPVQTQIVSLKDETQSRINYGANFKHLTSYKPTVDIYRVTFAVTIPQLTQMWQHAHINGTYRETGNSHNVTKAHFVEGNKVVDHAQTNTCFQITLTSTWFEEVTDEQMDIVGFERFVPCYQYRANIRFLWNASLEQYRSLHDMVDAIHALLPYNPSNPTQRIKERALLPIIGQLSKSLFGTASSEDVEILAKSVKQISETVNQELDIFKRTTGDMSSYMQKSNAQMDRLVKNVQDISLENFRFMENYTNDYNVRMSYANNVTLYMIKWIFHSNILLNHYESYLQAVTTLSAGHLSSFLIDEETLKKALVHVQEEIQAIHTTLQISHMETKFYYSHGTFVYMAINDTIYITLQLPLSTFDLPFHIYKVETFPMILQDHEHVTQLTDLPHVIAVSQALDFYYTLSETEAYNIQDTNHNKIQRVYYALDNDTCVIALFTENRKQINSKCKYTITPYTKKQQIFHQSDYSYILLNVQQYTLTCSNGTYTQQGCTSCVITIPVTCSYWDEITYVPPALSVNPSIAKKGHITNLAVIQKFFPAETFDQIEADKLLPEPPQVNIPSFKFFEHKVAKSLAAISDGRLDLDKTVERVKNDEVIVSALSQSIILGDVPLAPDFWITYPGVTLLTTSSALLLTILCLAFMSLKIRKLSIAFAVMQQMNGAHAHLQFQYEQLPTQLIVAGNMSDRQPLHTLVIEVSAKTGPMAVTIVILIALLGWIVYKCCKKRCEQLNMLSEMDLVLEIILAQRSTIVLLRKFRGRPANYLLVPGWGNSQNHDIILTGTLFPTLHINWTNAYLFDTITNTRIHLNNSYPISWIKTIQIRQVLKRECVCQPLWLYQGQFFVVSGENNAINAQITSVPNTRHDIQNTTMIMTDTNMQAETSFTRDTGIRASIRRMFGTQQRLYPILHDPV